MLKRVRRLRHDSEAGITLMELLVAMSLTTILGALAIAFFVTAYRAGNKSVLTNQDTGDARVALDSWTTMLRVASWLDPSTKSVRFEEVTPTKVVFFANLNNRLTGPTDSSVGPPTKVALLFNETNATTHDGELVEVRFVAGSPTTVQSVRRVALNVARSGTTPIFQPISPGGGDIDVNQSGCTNGAATQPGMCLQTAPAGIGTRDPSVAVGTSTVTSGNLRGVSATIDKSLGQIGGIRVSFTVRDPSHISTMDFASTATVSSGYPS